MNPLRKFILIIFALIWIVLIIWGVNKSGKLGPDKNLPLLTSLKKKTETFKGTRGKKEIDLTNAVNETPSAPGEETRITQEEAPVIVRAFAPKPIDFADTLSVMGTVKANKEYPLKFEIQGVIQKIFFREGDSIRKGDLIANLDPTDGRLKIEYLTNKELAAKKQYESLKKKLEIHQQLYEADAIIKTKLEEVELEIQSAKAQHHAAVSEKHLAEEEYKKNFIYAPTDGVLGKKEAEEGEFMTQQNELGTFFETSELFVEAGIVERDTNKIIAGQKAEIYIDAFPDRIFNGIIERIYPVVEGKSRTLTAKIKIINPETTVLPGMFSRVDIVTIELKSAIMIPTDSLIPGNEGVFLLYIAPESSLIEEEEGTLLGKVELKPVGIGYSSSDYTQALDTVREGDLIITQIQGDIQDGSMVRITGLEEFGYE